MKLTLRVRKAVELAKLDDWIEALPHGFSTKVGEGVSVFPRSTSADWNCQAIYQDPGLLILDEATSV